VRQRQTIEPQVSAEDAGETRSQKRRREKENWERNVRKACVNKGLAYQHRNGQNVPAKQVGPPCNENCYHKCTTKFSPEKQEKIFGSFYELRDKLKQWDFISRHLISVDKRAFHQFYRDLKQGSREEKVDDNLLDEFFVNFSD
jgi:hypothetical protein